jgi:hypothetical protein
VIDPGWAAVIAAFVSLLLGLAGLLRSASDSSRAEARERRERRAEAYVAVLRIVELRGLSVQDEMYNYTETGNDPHEPSLPRRDFSMPARTDRAEARALLAAYGTRETRAAFETWLGHVESWESKLALWFFENEVNGPPELASSDAEPERTAERAARSALGDAVSREVVY